MIIPIANYIVTEDFPKTDKKTTSGLFLPGSDAEETLQTTKVISVGEAVTKVSVGQKIMFKPYANLIFADGVHKYFVVSEDDVIGIEK